MKKNEYGSWGDMLKAEGILCRGYGVIPKLVMQDRELTIQAKAIYALFCSLSGKGETSFPGMETILSLLDIGKDTYYKHRSLLEAQGYINITQRHNNTGFTSNEYTLVAVPQKFAEEPEDEGAAEVYSEIRSDGIKSGGYGIIPYALMSDPRLTIKAKAIYAYFASYAGAGRAAFPKREKILRDLGIAVNTYNNNLSKLKDLGYIKVKQRNKGGCFSVNDYYLCSFRNEAEEIPCIKNSETQKPYARKAETQKPQTQKAEPINNSTLPKTQKINNNISDKRGEREAPRDKKYQDLVKLYESLNTEANGSQKDGSSS